MYDVDSVTSHNLVEEEKSEELCSLFKTTYNVILEKLHWTHDEQHLGLQKEKYIFGNTKSTFNGKKPTLFIMIALQWDALEMGIKENEFMIKCTTFKRCRPMKRIKFVMDLFDRYVLNRHFDEKKSDNFDYIDIVLQCLSGYDGIALINDFNHIRAHEEGISQLECEHNDVDSGECIGGMMRKYRDNERRENEDDDESDDISNGFKQYVDSLGLRERHLLETSIKIHSFLCHEEHDGNGDQKEEEVGAAMSTVARYKSRTAELSGKFMNNFQTQEKSDKVDGKPMDNLPMTLRENGFRDDECSRFMKILFAQHYDSETIIDDLVDEEEDEFNLYPQSNLFPMLQHNLHLAKITKKHFGANRNDDDTLPQFTFGMTRLFHWKHFEDRPGYVSKPKYRSLKEECLQNRIHSMTIDLFSSTLFNAFMFRESEKARGLKANEYIGAINQWFEMPIKSPLSAAHIFVLLMYCNDTELQSKYKKFGCRERDSEQSLEELKEFNSEIAHWHRLVIEVVGFYGELVRPKQVFFTGLNVRLSFQTFTPLFNAPFSTTTSLNVATKFCGDEGVICKLIPAPGSRDRYFNVEWLSDFAYERERLIVFAESMTIVDIQYMVGHRMRSNEVFLRAFVLFTSLFQGDFMFPLLRERATNKHTKRHLEPWRVLLDLIRVYKATNGITMTSEKALNIKIPLYIQQLFYQLLDEFKKNKEIKLIIESELNLLHKSLRDELVITAPDVTNKLILSPFMRTLCDDNNIAVMEKYVWIIDNAQFDDEISSVTYYYNVPESGKVSFQFVMAKNTGDSSSVSIALLIDDTPFAVDGRWCVMVDEVGYTRNDIRFVGGVNGTRIGRYAFDDSLLHEVPLLTVVVNLYMSPTVMEVD